MVAEYFLLGIVCVCIRACAHLVNLFVRGKRLQEQNKQAVHTLKLQSNVLFTKLHTPYLCH